jgi:beta-1,4-mannosyltransferase
MPRPRVAVVLVLGDVGRSPRMQYHALSLARSCAFQNVFLVGYRGERCVPDVEADETIKQVLLTADLLPRPRARALYLIYAPLKAILQLIQLLWTLLVTLPRSDVLLLQNPPAVPTLAAAWGVRALRGGRVVVDWHNLGFSMLEHALRAGHPFVTLSRQYERFFGRLLDGHLCVTAAMGRWLSDEWGVGARVLHDRPPEFFRRLEPHEQHELFRRLAPSFLDANGAPLWREGESSSGGNSPWADGGTPWTTPDGKLREQRPSLLVSSTSWTADEDFGMLLEALVDLERRLEQHRRYYASTAGGPQVLVVVTGKGPLKAHYERKMGQLGLTRVAVTTMWLEPADYPALLGAADLGVCLHTSTSGLDLPMKVLDMFGCGLPVCAVGFACLGELVTNGSNGLVFNSATELAEQLYHLLAPTAAAAEELMRLRNGVATTEARRPRWSDNWRAVAAPLLVVDEGVRGRGATFAYLLMTMLAFLLAWRIAT